MDMVHLQGYGDYILDDKNVKNEFEAENKVKELFMNGSDRFNHTSISQRKNTLKNNND